MPARLVGRTSNSSVMVEPSAAVTARTSCVAAPAGTGGGGDGGGGEGGGDGGGSDGGNPGGGGGEAATSEVATSVWMVGAVGIVMLRKEEAAAAVASSEDSAAATAELSLASVVVMSTVRATLAERTLTLTAVTETLACVAMMDAMDACLAASKSETLPSAVAVTVTE
eukprot:2818419-Prymnesium_polylepis.2